jgi:hypothetical protein
MVGKNLYLSQHAWDIPTLLECNLKLSEHVIWDIPTLLTFESMSGLNRAWSPCPKTLLDYPTLITVCITSSDTHSSSYIGNVTTKSGSRQRPVPFFFGTLCQWPQEFQCLEPGNRH